MIFPFALAWGTKPMQTYTFIPPSHQTPSLQPLLSAHQRRGRKPLRWKHCWTILIMVWIFKSESNRKEWVQFRIRNQSFFECFSSAPPCQTLCLLSFSPLLLSPCLYGNLTQRPRTSFSKQVQRNDDAQIEDRCDLHDWLQCNFALICMDFCYILAELMDC